MIFAGIINQKNITKITDQKKLKAILSGKTTEEVFSHKTNTAYLIATKLSKNDADQFIAYEDKVLIGRIFDKKNYQHISKTEIKNLTKETLINDFWGKYVYLNDHEIARDITGQLPIFYCKLDADTLLFASNICLIVDYLEKTPKYNWKYLSDFIIHQGSYSNETAFENIYELPPGRCLNFKTHEIEHFWKPENYTDSSSYKEEDIAPTLKESLRAWTAPYKNIYLSLSGGLDSSSLLFCLKEILSPHQTLKAINILHSQVRSSDETFYAQKVCDEVGVELIKLDLSEDLPFSPFNKPGLKPNKPAPSLAVLSHLQKQNEIIGDDSSLFISGHGGDHIFQQEVPEISIIDYLFKNGFRGLYKKMESVANYYRKPIWKVMKRAGSEMLFGAKNIVDNKKVLWMTNELRKMATLKQEHYNLPFFMLPGKKSHIAMISTAFPTISLEGIDPSNPMFYPLLYQPAIELSLSIPTYMLYDEGFDRFPFRHAISTHYNTQNVWRRDKGETSGINQLGLKHNLDYILDLCLNGAFVKKGLVKKDCLEKSIIDAAYGNGDSLWPLMCLISAEIFLQMYDKNENVAEIKATA